MIPKFATKLQYNYRIDSYLNEWYDYELKSEKSLMEAIVTYLSTIMAFSWRE
jgi:hypothetical protein